MKDENNHTIKSDTTRRFHRYQIRICFEKNRVDGIMGRDARYLHIVHAVDIADIDDI